MTPKQRLLANKTLALAHQNIVDSLVFRECADLAMLAVVSDLPDTTDPAMAAAAYHRVMGARAFLRGFTSMSTETIVPAAVPVHNLNHRA